MTAENRSAVIGLCKVQRRHDALALGEIRHLIACRVHGLFKKQIGAAASARQKQPLRENLRQPDSLALRQRMILPHNLIESVV